MAEVLRVDLAQLREQVTGVDNALAVAKKHQAGIKTEFDHLFGSTSTWAGSARDKQAKAWEEGHRLRLERSVQLLEELRSDIEAVANAYMELAAQMATIAKEGAES